MTTSGDEAFWVMIGLLAVLAPVATVFWAIGNRRAPQGQSQVKEASHQYQALF